MRALITALSLVLLASSCSAESLKIPGASVNVEGRIIVPDGTGKLATDTEVQVSLENGKVLVTFPTPDGRFMVPRVPDGEHTLTVLAPNWVFPAVKLVTGAGVHNPVTASLPELPMAPSLPYPLLLRPMARAEYFEARKPINILGFLKTPYGMMGAFMVFSMFLLPKLKVDPEEYQRVVQQRDGSNSARRD